MCTSLRFCTEDFYFGRNMDIDCKWGERVVIVARNYKFKFKHEENIDNHFAMIGTASVVDGYPLFADAVNEKGLCMAGLNFPKSAFYHDSIGNKKHSIAPFEIIPWVLSKCKNTDEARALLSESEIVNSSFNDMPVATLHWHIADSEKSIVIEQTKSGLHIHDNPFDVLTNNPPFEWHEQNMSQYLNLTPNLPDGELNKSKDIEVFGKGAGSIGLPGDFSSASRFVKAAYLKACSVCGESEKESVSQFFHILDSVAVVNGSIRDTGKDYMTTYSCCTNVTKGIYYYKTYNSLGINSICMNDSNIDGDELIEFPME